MMTTRRHFAFALFLVSSAVSAWGQPWLGNQRYRIPVSYPATIAENKPFGVAVDFGELLAAAGINDRLQPASLRVVDENGHVIPFTSSGDFVNEQKGVIWWRTTGREDSVFVYFDTVEVPDKRPDRTIALVGVGDTLHFNNGRPAMANVAPLHSQYLHVDWDGDGKRDLIGWGYRIFEYGDVLVKQLGNAVYFYKNIDSSQAPLFAPRHRLKGSDGNYLQSDLLPQNFFSADWDEDGDPDFYGFGVGYWLKWWENTGKRDANGLWILHPAKDVRQFLAESEFRKAAFGIQRKSRAWAARGVRRIDWEGDGDWDLLVSYRKASRLRAIKGSDGVIPYGSAVMVFDLLENIGPGSGGVPEFAPPVTLRDLNRIPIHLRGHPNGSAEYVDWDGDGDSDLLFYSETDRPLEGGRMMFCENRGTREAPLFATPIPILKTSDSPFVLDWNNDGHFDVIAGGEFFENVNRNSGFARAEPIPARTPTHARKPHPNTFPKLVSRGYAQQTDPEILSYFTIAVDWEDDGDLDLLGGYHTGVRLFLNRGTTLMPVFDAPVRLQADGRTIDLPNWLDPQADEPSTYGPQGPTEPIYGWWNPTMGDWDNDGDLDLFLTGQRWETRYYENTGTRTEPVFARGRTAQVDGDRHEFSWRSKVSIGDLDGDGVMELVVTSDRDRRFYAYERAGTDACSIVFTRKFPLKLENGDPIEGWYGGQNNNGDNHSQLVDWDKDGDLDLINGTLWAVWYYENVGTKTKPIFRSHGKFKAGGNEINVFNHAGSFDAADWNSDGRLDLMIGTECPSDQPFGAPLHLFDRAYIENEVSPVKHGKLNIRSETPEPAHEVGGR